MSEATRISGDYILVCQPGSTDHYAAVEWREDDDGVLGWCNLTSGELEWTDAGMAEAFSPATWKPIDPPPSSLSHDGPPPQWVLDWQRAYRDRASRGAI